MWRIKTDSQSNTKSVSATTKGLQQSSADDPLNDFVNQLQEHLDKLAVAKTYGIDVKRLEKLREDQGDGAESERQFANSRCSKA